MTTLSESDLRVLRALADAIQWREIRCPECKTFHRKTCSFYERLGGTLDKLAPGWREAAK